MLRIPYRAAIARQPESLADCLAAAKGFAARDKFRPTGRLALVGIGASYQVAQAGAQYLRHCGLEAIALYPDEVTTLDRSLVLLSASGESAELLDVALSTQDCSKLALCREEINPLAALCDDVFGTQSGADNGASSTGYTGMLLAIALLAHQWSESAVPNELVRLPDTVAALLSGMVESCERAAGALGKVSNIDLVGSGIDYANAVEGAILLREATRIPASGWELRNYLHGPMESVDPSAGVITLGVGRAEAIADEAARIGAVSVAITSAPAVGGEGATRVLVPMQENAIARAIVNIAAVQLVGATMQDQAGLTDTRFRYPQSDTKRRASGA